MIAYAKGELGDAGVELPTVKRIIAIGCDRMMAAVREARHGVLAPYLDPRARRHRQHQLADAVHDEGTYVYRDPTVVYHGNMGTRTAFGVLLGLGLIGAIVGVADTAAAGDRAKAREKSLHGRFFVAPSFDGESATMTLGGSLWPPLPPAPQTGSHPPPRVPLPGPRCLRHRPSEPPGAPRRSHDGLLREPHGRLPQ